jgi:hypothetical protein
MSLQTRFESLVVRLAAEFKTIYSRIGQLSSLSTTDKSSLVASINELRTLVQTASNAQLINDAQAAVLPPPSQPARSRRCSMPSRPTFWAVPMRRLTP